MKIKPNYLHDPLCHYCKKNKAVEKRQNNETWYGVLKSHSIPLSIEYVRIKVGIPRCEECYKKHSNETLPGCIIFLISFASIAYFIFVKGDNNYDNHEIAELCLGIFLQLLVCIIVSGIIAFVLGKIIEYTIHSFSTNNGKAEGETRDYDPIRKLIGCGFQFTKPDAAKSKGYKKIDIDRYNNALKSIIEKDDCIIEK